MIFVRKLKGLLATPAGARPGQPSIAGAEAGAIIQRI